MAVMTYCEVKQAQSFSFWLRVLPLSLLFHVLLIAFWLNEDQQHKVPLEMVSRFNVVLNTQQKSQSSIQKREVKAERPLIKKRFKTPLKQREVAVKRHAKLESAKVVNAPKPDKKTLAATEVADDTIVSKQQLAYVSPRITTDIDNRKPYYPKVARRRGMQGNVVLQVSVGLHGEVLNVSIKQSSGYQILDEAAKEAIKQWQFQPAQRNGKFEVGRIEIPVRFNLQDSG